MASRRPWGSIVADELVQRKDPPLASRDGETWHLCRPVPYYSLTERLRMAWDVLRYRADALYWRIDEP